MNKHYLRALTMAVAVFVFLASCKKDSHEDESPVDPPVSVIDTATGPLTDAEIESLPELTYQQIIDAYDSVISKKPALAQDEQNLVRAVFRYLMGYPIGEARHNAEPELIAGIEGMQGTQGILDKLNKKEKEVVFKDPKNFYQAMWAYLLAHNPAVVGASSEYPCDHEEDGTFDDTKGNAVLHAYWNALMVRHASLEFAEALANAHEDFPGNDGIRKKMDLHNNKIGRDLTVAFPDATDKQLLELLVEKKFLFIASGDTIPKGADALVYIKNLRPYDGTMTGTLTNPDAGSTVWNVTFDFNQCGTLIRGQYIISSGPYFQKRRFSGNLNEDGSITLSVANPYAFENPDGLAFCINVAVALTGNENNRNGIWTSSNCRKGGSVNISR